MKNLNNYLDEAKLLTGSDRQTALKIGISPQYMSDVRKGKRFSDDCALLLSEILSISVIEIIAAMRVERCDKPEVREKWGKLLNEVQEYILC